VTTFYTYLQPTPVRGRRLDLNVFDTPLQSVCYLTSYLKKRGHAVEVVNFFNKEKRRFDRLLRQRPPPRAVAITTTFYVSNTPVIELIEFMRARSPETRIVLGGPHILNLAADHDPTTLEHVFDRIIGADIYIVDSQGEKTLDRVVRALREGGDLGAIPNLFYRDGGDFRATPREIEDNDLDANSVEWSLLDPASIRPTSYLRTARSCPFVCAFCNYPTMAGTHTLARIETVERELRALHDIRRDEHDVHRRHV
jgi:radical SAM superfamily enzyme YgiQ (UPF0313 family)